jgi:sec-independent protein translocase protein TatA
MNIGDLFDSPLKVLIIAIVVIVLFGSRKLPAAARSLGQSMRILKTEVQGLHEDEAPTATATALPTTPAKIEAPVAPAASDAQAQIDALSRQLSDLQQTVGKSDAQA